MNLIRCFLYTPYNLRNLNWFFFTALSGKFDEMMDNEIGEFDETPDVSELEALKRSGANALYNSLPLAAVAILVLL